MFWDKMNKVVETSDNQLKEKMENSEVLKLVLKDKQ